MTKRSSKYYLLHGIVVSVVALVCLLSYAITKSLTVAEDKLQENLEYVSYEVLTDNIMPVSKEETNDEIVRPYTDTSVEIGKSYYDYKEVIYDVVCGNGHDNGTHTYTYTKNHSYCGMSDQY